MIGERRSVLNVEAIRRRFWGNGMRRSFVILASAIALSISTISSAMAQPPEAERPSSLILFGLRRVGCDIAIQVIETYLGLGDAARAAAERWGICPPVTIGGPGSGGSSPIPETILINPTPPAGGLQPGFSLTLLEVSGPTASTLTPAGPNTRYSQGEGFVALLNFNAPGYLEVWSVDGESETFVEAIALNPDGGTTLALPARGSPAFYQFITPGTATEYLRIRFYPCRGLSGETFGITRNSHLADALNALGTQGSELRQSLPSCPLASSEFNPERSRPIFGSSLSVPVEWSNTESRYVAVLDRVVHEGRRSMTVDIPLRRE